MVKKLFALASVSALAGLMAATGAAGCSSTEDSPGTSDSKDAGKDASKPKPSTDKDATAGDDDDTTAAQCWKDDEVDVSKNPYKPPFIDTTACSENAGKAVKDAFTGAKTWQDVIDNVTKAESDTCAKCIFQEDTGDTWAPVVLGDKDVTVNFGGCVGIVSGNEDCGKAVQLWNDCLDTACKDCSSDEATDCAKAVQSTACATATDDLGTACGKDVNKYLSACNGLVGSVEKQCTPKGATISDGGDGG